MLLSEVLAEMDYQDLVSFVNEKPFKYLALTESNIDYENCVFLDSSKFIDSIDRNVSMVLTTEEMKALLLNKHFGLCIVKKPRELFFEIHNYLCGKRDYVRKSYETALGENCIISPLASIAEKNVSIGNNVIIEEFVVIRENTVIQDNSILRAGCKIGGVGFEFKRNKYGIASVTHVGGVIIGKEVEIQYNTCVDRAIYPWDDTIIGDYCKIDNLVHIAHGVKMDRNVMVVANSGIGGRTIINEKSWIGFGVTIKNGITVGKDARANMGAVVTKSIPDNGSVTGNFAIDHSKFLISMKKSITED